MVVSVVHMKLKTFLIGFVYQFYKNIFISYHITVLVSLWAWKIKLVCFLNWCLVGPVFNRAFSTQISTYLIFLG